jgi:3-methylcrotonyl-CoA carboxylase beta subunit
MNIEFNKNEDKMQLLISAMEKKLERIYLGGGKSKIEKLHEQGKMTARERIAYLLDEKSETIEIGAFAGEDMYKEHGGCPSGGVVVVIGYVHNRQCIVVANDATVKAGAWFPITGKKKSACPGNSDGKPFTHHLPS